MMQSRKLFTQYIQRERGSFANFIFTLLLVFVFFFLLPTSYSLPTAFAATLSLDPFADNYGPGDMFVVTVRLDTAPGECINAANIELLYPTDWLKVTAVSNGESLMTLWTEEPKIDSENGKVSFSGGIPAGYCGRVQGDPGKTNILAKVVFGVPGNMIGGKTATGPVPMNITFSSTTKVLLNDGFGTPAELKIQNASFTHVLNSSGITNEWLNIVHADNIPPDEFKISIAHEATTFAGKYFIVFLAVDKQSGVHHYEVREDDPLKLDFVRGKNVKATFAIATSPYVLNDQELKSRVMVRAIDNAGNVQESILGPSGGVLAAGKSNETGNNTNERSSFWWIFGALLVLPIAGVTTWLRARRSKKVNSILLNPDSDEHTP